MSERLSPRGFLLIEPRALSPADECMLSPCTAVTSMVGWCTQGGMGRYTQGGMGGYTQGGMGRYTQGGYTQGGIYQVYLPTRLYHPGYTSLHVPPWVYRPESVTPWVYRPESVTPWVYHLGYYRHTLGIPPRVLPSHPGYTSLHHPFHCWTSTVRP